MTITARSVATFIAVASSVLVTWWSAASIAKPQIAPALFQVGAAFVDLHAAVSGGQGKAGVAEVTIVDGAGTLPLPR